MSEEKNKKLAEETLRLKQQELQIEKEIERMASRRGALQKDEINAQNDVSNILQDQTKHLKLSYNERRKINSITKKLNDLAQETYTFNNKTLGVNTKSEKINKQIVDAQQKIKILGLQRSKINDKESKAYVAQADLRREINQGIVDQIALSSRVIKQLERQAEVAKEIEGNKIANSFGGIGNMLEKIPLVSALAPSFKAAEEAAREAGAEVTLFGKGMMDAGDYSKESLGKLGPDVKVVSDKKFTEDSKAVKKLREKGDEAGADALVGTNKVLFGAAAQKSLEAGTAKLEGITAASASSAAGFAKMIPMIGKLIAAFAFKSLLEADKNITSFQKNLGVSYGEAYRLNNQLNATATTTDNLRVNIASLHQALGALNDAYGTALMFNEETLVTSAELLDSKILDADATARLSQSARLNGIEMKEALQTQEDAVNAVNKENNTRISLKKVLQDSNKIGGQLRAQLGANPEAIAKVVTQAKALGMELEQVAAAGKALLDFESSIENELTAELMLGKELNLEKARLAALTGDYETLTKEINKNVGDFGDFTKMNVLQQEALAASVGMTADQLSDQLMKKADLEKLAQEALDSGDKQRAQDLMALSTQEKFEKAVLKVKDAFVAVMSVISPIVRAVGLIADGINAILPAVIGLTVALGVMNRKLIFGAIVSAFQNAMKVFSSIPVVGWGLGIAAGLASVAIIKGAAAKAGDVMSPADGKTQISTKEGGLFELSKNDDVAAGPGILDKLKGAMKGGPMGLMGDMMGMLNPFSGLTSIVSNMAEAIVAKFDVIVGTVQQQLISEPIPVTMMTEGGGEQVQLEGETQISMLEKKLDEIKIVLQQRQNITLDVNNKLTYDSFSENTTSYLNGKEAQETINDSSFV